MRRRCGVRRCRLAGVKCVDIWLCGLSERGASSWFKVSVSGAVMSRGMLWLTLTGSMSSLKPCASVIQSAGEFRDCSADHGVCRGRADGAACGLVWQ